MKNKITDKLFELAYTDSMTEVQNRNAYEERLKKLRKPSANAHSKGALPKEFDKL